MNEQDRLIRAEGNSHLSKTSRNLDIGKRKKKDPEKMCFREIWQRREMCNKTWLRLRSNQSMLKTIPQKREEKERENNKKL